MAIWDQGANVLPAVKVNRRGPSGANTEFAADDANKLRAALMDVYGNRSGPDVVNVKDPAYGAKGDGTTDDTAAIQAALTAGAGKDVLGPAGTYLVSSSLTVPANTRFAGAGPYAASAPRRLAHVRSR